MSAQEHLVVTATNLFAGCPLDKVGYRAIAESVNMRDSNLVRCPANRKSSLPPESTRALPVASILQTGDISRPIRPRKEGLPGHVKHLEDLTVSHSFSASHTGAPGAQGGWIPSLPSMNWHLSGSKGLRRIYGLSAFPRDAIRERPRSLTYAALMKEGRRKDGDSASPTPPHLFYFCERSNS